MGFVLFRFAGVAFYKSRLVRVALLISLLPDA